MYRTKELHRHCPICNFDEGYILHHQQFILPDGHPLSDGYDIAICQYCGFAFADTTIPQSAYDKFYTQLSKYGDANVSTGGGGSASDLNRLNDTAHELEKLLSPQMRILDIGCAGGGLLHALQKRGFMYLVGLDPSPACVHYGKYTFGLEMHQGTLENIPYLGQFDVVLLSHVLEHVQDLYAAMKSIKSILRPTGYAYVEVPDAMRYTECLISPFQDFNTEHINHFNMKSLNNLATISGFIVEDSATKTIEAAINVPYPAVWQLWRKRNNLTISDLQCGKDVSLQRSLNAYVNASKKMLDGMNESLHCALDTPIAVWGTGQLAMKLLAETVLGQCDIAFWIDSNPVLHGHDFHGAKVLSPEEGAARLHKSPFPIVIASTIHSVAITKHIINELHLEVPIITL